MPSRDMTARAIVALRDDASLRARRWRPEIPGQRTLAHAAPQHEAMPRRGLDVRPRRGSVASLCAGSVRAAIRQGWAALANASPSSLQRIRRVRAAGSCAGLRLVRAWHGSEWMSTTCRRRYRRRSRSRCFICNRMAATNYPKSERPRARIWIRTLTTILFGEFIFDGANAGFM